MYQKLDWLSILPIRLHLSGAVLLHVGAQEGAGRQGTHPARDAFRYNPFHLSVLQYDFTDLRFTSKHAVRDAAIAAVITCIATGTGSK